MSAATAGLLRCDAAGWGGSAESFSIVIPVLVNEAGGTAFQKVVFEAAGGGQLVFALVYETDGATYWRFSWHVGNSQSGVVGENIGFDPGGRVCAVAVSYQKRTAGAALSRLRVCVYVPGMAATNFSESFTSTTTLSGAPTSWGIGRRYTNVPANNANMRGLFILWVLRASAMGGQLVADGRTLDDGVASVNVRNLIFPTPDATDFCGAPAKFPGAVLYALNHSCSGRLWNGYADCRPGKTTPTCAVFDLRAADFGRYWNRGGGGQFTGSIKHVNPYTQAGLTTLPPPVNTTLQQGITAPFTTDGPTGVPGAGALRFMAAARGEYSGQLSVLFVANSRGVTSAGPAELRLNDGTFAGRTLLCTYPEAGVASLAPLWNGGLIGMSNLPIPTGLYDFGALAVEAGNGSPEPLFGADCNEARPSCRDLTTLAPVPVRVATTRLVNSSYSRTWAGSRYATTVAGQTARFQGNAAPRSVNIGFEYRVLIRPEAGMPTTDGLEIGFYVLRNPLGSTFFYRKAIASGQAGSDALDAPYVKSNSDVEAGNVSDAPVVDAGAPRFINDFTVGDDGFVVIDNTSGRMTPGHVGQWLEIVSTVGVRQDIACISAVDNTNPQRCRVYYEGAVKREPIPSDRVYWLTTPSERYHRIVVKFDGGETTLWRGISIQVASSAAGFGADLLGLHFRNTDRLGVISGQAARSGCGISYQQARYFYSVTPSLETSPFQEMVKLINPDVCIVCTADQGDTISFADVARNTMVTFVQRWTNAKAGLEPILYSTGPEFASEISNDYAEDAKASFHVAYRQAAGDLGIPHLSLYYDLVGGTGCMNAHLTGEVTESRTHPSTGFDVERMVSQLERLSAVPCMADFNQDGGVDGQDVQVFFDDWEHGRSRSDVNLDGGVDGSDVVAFFAAWEAGGC